VWVDGKAASGDTVRMAGKKERLGNELPEGTLSHNPFAALGGGGRGEESGESSAAPEAAVPDPARGKLVVRFEARGHGGKPITRVQGLALDAARLEDLARDLRRALGAGARVDGEDLVVQGRQQDRVISWLEQRGHAGAVRGN